VPGRAQTTFPPSIQPYDAERCWLSSYAFTGNEHKSDCRFYSVWCDERQAEIYQGEGVRAASDGTIVVRLPTGLQKKASSDVKTG